MNSEGSGGGGAETGGSCRLFVCSVFNNAINDKFKIVLGHLICQFDTDENSKNKRMVVPDPIGRLGVNKHYFICQ